MSMWTFVFTVILTTYWIHIEDYSCVESQQYNARDGQYPFHYPYPWDIPNSHRLQENRMPWMVSLQNPILRHLREVGAGDSMRWASAIESSHICSGVMLNENWIIASRHCSTYCGSEGTRIFSPQDELIINSWTARMGTNDLLHKGFTQIEIPIDKIVIPGPKDQMHGGNNGSDIILFHLSISIAPSSNIVSGQISHNTIASGTRCILAGWEPLFKAPGIKLSPTLRYMSVELMSMVHCDNSYTNEHVELYRAQATEIKRNEQAPVCLTDSDGPMFCPNKEYGYLLAGLAWKPRNCENKSCLYFTNLSHYRYYIEEAMHEAGRMEIK